MNNNTTFLETYAQIEQLLHELLCDVQLTFTTSRARFLYLCDTHHLAPELKKLGSYVFNTHFTLLNHHHTITDKDIQIANYLYEQIYNHFHEEKISLTDYVDHFANIAITTENVDKRHTQKLECYLKDIEISQTNKGYPLYKFIANDTQAEDTVVYLWLDTDAHQTPFHRCWDLIVQSYPHIHKVVFYHLTYSDKGYYFQNDKTYLVVEPDFLMDVTTIAECFQNRNIVPELFFMRFIRTSETSLAMLKGNFVNYLLDAIFSGKEIVIHRDFYVFAKKQLIKLLWLSDKDIAGLLSEVQSDHLTNLYEVAKIFENNTVTLEPSFISSEYGLQGRLDALIEYDDDPHRKSIFELKTANPPKYSTWQNHYAQVMGYNMLLRSVYGEQKSGESMIFYSKTPEDRLRNVTYSELSTRQITMCRNIIVGKLFQLTSGQYDFMQDIHRLRGAGLPGYLSTEIERYESVYNGLRPFEKEYFRATVSFMFKEMMAKKIGYIDSSGAVRQGFSALWSLSLAEKIRQKIVLQRLVFRHVDNGLFVFEIRAEGNDGCEVDALNAFRENDPLLLYPANSMGDVDKSVPLHTPVYKAVLRKITSEYIAVQFRNEFITEQHITRYPYLYAEPDQSDISAFDLPSSFIHFFQLDPLKREIFLGLQKPRIDIGDLGYVRSEDINAIPTDQKNSVYDQVIHKAKNFTDYLLIQGPPGTGKTSKYLIGIVKQHLVNNQTPIVISAYTHKAIEEICQNLQKNEIEYILLGSRYADTAFISSDATDDFSCLLQSTREKLSTAKVFVSTVLNLLIDIPYLRKYVDLDLLIVDEASQILEYQLVATIGLFQRFILIGDHFQLPAIITQKNPVGNDGNRSASVSLFEKLYIQCEQNGWTESYHLLSEHFRMHTEIASLINPFYANKLNATVDRQREPFTYYGGYVVNDERLKDITTRRTLFLPTREVIHTRFSREEADTVRSIVQIVYAALGDRFDDKTVGVICPWKLQVNLIHEYLADLPVYRLITIDTVERFQGSERDIIIYSTAISSVGDLKRMQSLTSDGLVDRKLNVAISRAKEQFILLGNESLLRESEHYRGLRCF